MDKRHLRILRMIRPAVDSPTRRRADHHWHANTPAKTILRRKIHDLIVGTGNEIGKLHLDDRTQARHRRANRRANDGTLAHWRVDHAALAELLKHARGYFERAAVNTDILAQQEDVFVALQLFPDALADRFEI